MQFLRGCKSTQEKEEERWKDTETENSEDGCAWMDLYILMM